jgi:YbbR domain-containing protein
MNNENSASGTKSRIGRGLSNWLAFFACVLSAILIWFYVMQTESPYYETTYKSVEITLSGGAALAAKGLSVISGQGSVADVILSGKKSDTLKFSPADITAFADISGISDVGRYSIAVEVTPPTGLALVSLTPMSLSLNIDRLDSVMVPVRVDITDMRYNSDKYTVAEPVITPSEISVSGPSSILAGISHAEITFGFSSPITSSQNVTGNVSLISISGEEVTHTSLDFSPKSVNVQINVTTVPDLPIVTDINNIQTPETSVIE